MRLWKCLSILVPLATLLACSDSFTYTGFNTDLNPGYDHTVSIQSELTKPVRVEALVLLNKGPLVLTITDPAGHTSDLRVEPSPEPQVVAQRFTDTLGRWTVRLASQGEGRVRIKLHTRNDFEGFSADERGYVLALGREKTE